MGRLCRFLGLAGLLLAVGHCGFAQQVNTSTGTAVVGNTVVMPAAAPVIIAPPAVALPGSGTPVGAPVSAPSVLTITPHAVSVPNAPVSAVGPLAAPPAAGVSATTNATTNANIGATPASSTPNAPTGFSPGIARFESPSARGMTVADAAARFKSEKASTRARMITNQDIYALNSRHGNGVGMNTNNESMPQADVPADQNQGDAASNGALDQHDLDAVNRALARSRAKQAAADKAAADKQQQDNAAQPRNPKQ